MKLESQVIITSHIDDTVARLEALRKDERIIKIIKEDRFLVDDAKLAIEKAYIASDVTTVIILASSEFSDIIQNRLLKVLEEPPKGVEFILITHSKATVLPTIRSRMAIRIIKESKVENIEIDMSGINLSWVYSFIQEHKRVDLSKAKVLIEQITIGAMRSKAFRLDKSTLKLSSDAYRALDVGSSPQFVLTTLLLKLLAKKRG
jgi:DNA polymerase-3 subunit delta'